MKKEAVIILAEDDEGHARLIIRTLRKAGFDRVILFEDGQSTLDFLFRRGNGPHRDNETPYLLLLDISMPLVSGIEVLQQVKQDKELQNIPVVMISTTDDTQNIERCYQLGCSKFITKSINYKKLIKEISKIGTYCFS